MGKRDIFDMVKTSMFDRDMIPSGILVLVKWVASVWFIFSIFTTPGRGYSQKRHGPAFVAFLRALAGHQCSGMVGRPPDWGKDVWRTPKRSKTLQLLVAKDFLFFAAPRKGFSSFLLKLKDMTQIHRKAPIAFKAHEESPAPGTSEAFQGTESFQPGDQGSKAGPMVQLAVSSTINSHGIIDLDGKSLPRISHRS